MMDTTELKKLAEAATQGTWKKHEGRLGGVVYGGPVQHWVRGSGQSQIAMTTGAEWMRPGENEANAAFIAAANPAAVLALIAENDRIKDENEVARMRIKELDLLFGRYLLGMRSAVIDEECGGHGMAWIYNALRGPGELPPEDEADAQAYFDREIVAVDAGLEEVAVFFDARRADKKVKP